MKYVGIWNVATRKMVDGIDDGINKLSDLANYYLLFEANDEFISSTKLVNHKATKRSINVADKNQNKISESTAITKETHVSLVNYAKGEEIFVKVFSVDTLNNPEHVSYSITAVTKSGKYSETEGKDSFKAHF